MTAWNSLDFNVTQSTGENYAGSELIYIPGTDTLILAFSYYAVGDGTYWGINKYNCLQNNVKELLVNEFQLNNISKDVDGSFNGDLVYFEIGDNAYNGIYDFTHNLSDLEGTKKSDFDG